MWRQIQQNEQPKATHVSKYCKVNNLRRIQTLHKMTTISKHISVNIGIKTSFIKVNKTKTVRIYFHHFFFRFVFVYFV